MVREKEADNELLEFQPPELRFHFEANKLIPCPLNLINRTDQRVAFMLYPGKRKRYFTKWLCGVVPPRSTYTLTVTMKKQLEAATTRRRVCNQALRCDQRGANNGHKPRKTWPWLKKLFYGS